MSYEIHWKSQMVPKKYNLLQPKVIITSIKSTCIVELILHKNKLSNFNQEELPDILTVEDSLSLRVCMIHAKSRTDSASTAYRAVKLSLLCFQISCSRKKDLQRSEGEIPNHIWMRH